MPLIKPEWIKVGTVPDEFLVECIETVDEASEYDRQRGEKSVRCVACIDKRNGSIYIKSVETF